MEFQEKIDRNLLQVDFAPRSKDDALRQIAALAKRSPLFENLTEQEIYDSLAAREDIVSTGIGGGVAIPHARFSGLKDFLVFVLIAPRGVDYDALDKKKTRVFFVVFAPEDQVNNHIKILASISRVLSHGTIKKELIKTSDPQILYEIITRNQSEENSSSAAKKKLMFIILYYHQHLQDVLEFLLDQGVDGASVISSKGMGAYISNMPLFAGFLSFMREDRNASNTIMALIPADEEAAFVRGIEDITGDLDKNQGAMVMTLDISFYKGTMSML